LAVDESIYNRKPSANDKGKMRALKFVLPPLIIAAGAFIFWYLTGTATPPEPLRAEPRAPVVSVRAAAKVTAAPTLRLFGRVEAATTSVLTAGVAADVIAVTVLEGEAVRRGQLLVRLDAVDAELQLRSRRAELADIDAQLEADAIGAQSDRDALATEEELLALQGKAVDRARRLLRSRSGSEAALEQARQAHERERLAVIQRRLAVTDYPARRRQMEARRARAAAAAQMAERDLARSRVTAPFAGRVTQVFVAPGERVGVGAQLLEVFDRAALELRAQAPSSHLPALRRALAEGRAVTATVAGAAPLRLTLHRLAAQVGRGQGGVDAFFRVAGDGGGGGLPAPGSTLEIHLALPALDDVVLLSPDSLYGDARVYLVRDNRLQAKTVRRLGRLESVAGDGDGAGDGLQLIVDGADFVQGDMILDSRLPQAIDGLQVRVAPAN